MVSSLFVSLALGATLVCAQFPAWPTATDSKKVPATIPVPSYLDGKFVRYYADASKLGDGEVGEGQKPIFELADGAVLKNVIIGKPAADGVHCLGSCTLENVWWEDVGEDAATFLGGDGAKYTVNTGGAKLSHDKVFQHNGGGTLTVKNFQVDNSASSDGAGSKLWQACGTCPARKRNVVFDAIRAKGPLLSLAGVMTNNGDTATFSNIQVDGKVGYICQRYCDAQGSCKTGQYKANQNGDGGQCKYTTANIKQI
ncbi:pectate lyase [Aphelenchoides avenae]|nr:pectate lyase [Aphelenchus avenae]